MEESRTTGNHPEDSPRCNLRTLTGQIEIYASEQTTAKANESSGWNLVGPVVHSGVTQALTLNLHSFNLDNSP